MAGPPKANSIASGSRPSLATAPATAQRPHPMIEIDGPDGNPANPCLVGGHRHRAPGVRRRWFGAPGTRRDAFSAMRYCTSTVPGAGYVKTSAGTVVPAGFGEREKKSDRIGQQLLRNSRRPPPLPRGPRPSPGSESWIWLRDFLNCFSRRMVDGGGQDGRAAAHIPRARIWRSLGGLVMEWNTGEASLEWKRKKPPTPT